MTEKRFTIDDGDGQTVYWYIKEDGVVIGKKCGKKNIAYVVERLNQLYDENKQLKQQNDRQAKRLGELYELMAKKDWESLTEIIDDFCSCEEQLQRESRTYGDWND